MANTHAADDGVMDSISEILYPSLRLLLAGLTVWYSSGASAYVSHPDIKYYSKNGSSHFSRFCQFRNPRYFSGVLSATLSGFLTYVFLEPLFVPVGLDLANVALWVLAIYASMVGMSLGVLLPTLCPGLCFGASISLLFGCLLQMSKTLYFPIAGGLCALLGAIFSAR